MNYIWSGLFIISFIFAYLSGNLQETLSAGLAGATEATTVLLSFAGIMCFWSGILKIAASCGAVAFCERLLSPVIRRLFPKTKNRTHITANIIANLLGLGNAATPAGLSAMGELDRENGKSPTPSHEMSRFIVRNTASLQLFPTTIIGLLSAAGARNPFSVIPLIWISSALSLLAALIAETFLPGGGEQK